MADEKSGAKRRPLWQMRMIVSEKRNLSVTIWPPFPGSDIQKPSVVLDEGRVDKDGNWTHTKIPLATGRMLELAELLHMAWREYRRLATE